MTGALISGAVILALLLGALIYQCRAYMRALEDPERSDIHWPGEQG